MRGAYEALRANRDAWRFPVRVRHGSHARLGTISVDRTRRGAALVVSTSTRRDPLRIELGPGTLADLNDASMRILWVLDRSESGTVYAVSAGIRSNNDHEIARTARLRPHDRIGPN